MDALGHKRRKPSGCLSFVLIALGFPLIFFFGSDQVCRFDINRRLPNYPNATLVTAEHNGLRLKALGTTEMVFSTSDDYETVAQWYRNLNLEQLDKGIFNGMATINRWVEQNPEGNGTLIYYVTECGL
jgi:hypothetical protein